MSTLTVGTIAEKVTDAGVAVDGVTLKDGGAVFTSAITATDNTVDLGASGTRFKDIYLSGGAFLGGTGSANKISDYEEGSWTPSWTASGGGSGTYNYQVGRYTKIGNRVCINGYLSLTNKNTLSGTLSMAGLPFTSSNISQGYYSVAIWCNSTTNGGSADGDFFLQAFIDHNEADSIFMYTLDGDGGVAGITDSMLTNTSDFMVNCMYQTDL